MKRPSEKDVKKKIEKANQKLDGLYNLKERADRLNEQVTKIKFSDIKSAIDEAEKARTVAEGTQDKNYTEADKKAEEALKLIKASDYESESLWWGWRAQLALGVIALGIMLKISDVPRTVYYWGILGAVAYIVFSISLHYKYRELDTTQLLFGTARIIQSPILAGAVYLVLIDLTSTQELIYYINQTMSGSNISTPVAIPITKVSSNTLMTVSFLVGFFTEAAVGFLRTLSKKLLPE